MRLMRVYYKVVKNIVLSDSLFIEQSKQIRRMDTGEVLEVSAGPKLDPSIGIYRVQGRALKDGVIGWATIAGNQGITFLTPGGTIFRVATEVALSEELRDLQGAKTLRMLQEGEILEVLEWARTSKSSLGVTRVRVRVPGEGTVGWVTIAANDG